MTTTAMESQVPRAWSQTVRCLAVMIALIFAAATVRSEETKGVARFGNKLIGTWKLVSAKYGGADYKFDDGTTTIKHVTDSQFMWLSYDKDGKVTRTAGGDYTLKGDMYEETPKYGFSEDFDGLKGKPQKFTWKVEGNNWHHNGKLSNGLTIEEVWERIVGK